MIDYTPKKKIDPYKKFSSKPVKLTIDSPVKSGYNPRRTTEIKSSSSMLGSTSKKEPMTYTGDKVIGITILHKSCLQPVFSQEEAVSVALMRR